MNEESEQLTRTTDVSCVVRITSESNPRATRLTARRSNGSALHTLDHQFSKSRAQKVRAQTPILPGGPTRVKGASLLNIRALDGLARRARHAPRWPGAGPRATLGPMETTMPADRRRVAALVPTERRSGEERRSGAERRTPESVAEHIRNALQLLTNVAESGTLDEESLRDLDAAMFRLRFALDRFEARQ